MNYVTAANFNYVESLLWFLIALVVFITQLKQKAHNPYQLISIVAIIGFILFGFSDIIEAHTGAWWRPLSLLVLKSFCVITLIGCYYQFRRIRAKNPPHHRQSD